MQKNGLNLRDRLDLVFFKLSKKTSRQERHCLELLEDLKLYMKEDPCLKNDDKMVQELKDRLLKQRGKSLQVLFLCEYGCVLLVEKEKENSEINIKILYPIVGQKMAFNFREQEYYDDLIGYKIEHCVSLKKYSSKLPQFFQKFKRELQEELQANTSGKTLLELKTAIGKVERVAVSKRSGRSEDWSTKNTNMAWFLVQSLMRSFAIGSQKCKRMVEKLIIGYKGYLLEKVTEQEEDLAKNYSEVEKYQDFLKELTLSYKQNEEDYEEKTVHQPFFELISRISQNINKSIGGSPKTFQINNENNDQSLELSKKGEELGVDILPRQFKSEEKKQFQPQCNVISQQIDRRFLFQDLLDELQLIQKTQNASLKDLLRDQWILLVQRTMFEFASELNSRRNLVKGGDGTAMDLGLKMSQIWINNEVSPICEVIDVYETEIDKNLIYYGMGMKDQAISHLYLVKAIAAAVVFEEVKLQRCRDEFNLSEYRIPIQIPILFDNFTSLKNEARAAMQNMKEYHEKRWKKKALFVLDGTCNSFQQFAEKLRGGQKNMQHWFKLIQELDYPHRNVKAKLRENSPVSALLHATPADILGLMKISFLAQKKIEFKPVDPKYHYNFVWQDNSKQKFPINYGKMAGNQSSYIQIRFQDKLGHLFGEDDFFKPQIPEHALMPFIKKSKGSTKREHLTYATRSIKPGFLSDENFVAQCNIRAQQCLELTLLCENILSRKMQVDCYHDQGSLLSEEVFLRAAGQISSYLPSVEKKFGEVLLMLNKIMEQVWDYTFATFVPVLAPFIQCISRNLVEDGQRNLNADQILFRMAKQCQKLYLKGEEDEYLEIEFRSDDEGENEKLAEKRKEKVWMQRFLCFAAIICFRERKLEEKETEEILFLARMIIEYRSCIIGSAGEQKPAKVYKFDEKFDFGIQQTIFNNIETLSSFFYRNPQELSQIISTIHRSFPRDATWNQSTSSFFTCVIEEKRYDVDLCQGFFYIDGKREENLQKPKREPNYLKIFGAGKDFQVIESNYPEYVRTKKNINHHFHLPNQGEQDIFMEFEKAGKDIRYIVFRQGEVEGEIWELYPVQSLRKANFQLASLFLESYAAWLCRDRKCIVFRKKDFNTQFHEIGLILILDASLQNVSFSYLVNKEKFTEEKLLSFLSSQNRSTINQSIVLRSREQLNQIKAYRILRRLEKPEYILELIDEEKKKILWLHRYDLRFVESGNKLISESYDGYELDFSFYEKKECLFNDLECLVLKKSNESTLAGGERILLLKNNLIPEEGLHQIVYKCNIHDYYRDIRGETRESQMFLAKAMLDINNNVKVEPIGLTPLEYAMYLLKSCIGNTPFSIRECEIFNKIMDTNNPQLYLFCLGFWKTSYDHSGELQFYKEQNAGKKNDRAYTKMMKEQEDEKSRNEQMNQKIEKQFDLQIGAKDIYVKDYKNNAICYHQKLSTGVMGSIAVSLSHSYEKILTSGYLSQDNKKLAEIESEMNLMIEKDFETYLRKNQELVNFIDEQMKPVQNEQGHQESSELLEITKIAEEKKPESKAMKNLLNQQQESLKKYKAIQKRMQRLRNISSSKLKGIIEGIVEICNTLDENAEGIFKSIIEESQKHCDSIIGLRPTFNKVFFTQFLCEEGLMEDFLPFFTQSAIRSLKQTIKIWMECKTRLASMKRVTNLLNQQQKNKQNDIRVALLREVKSPRKQLHRIEENEENNLLKCLWLCFETEMKVQVWLDQYEVFEHLIKGERGSEEIKGFFCQLNMGEGKTQIIIPMIVLHTIYICRKKTPRINLLSSLYEEAKGNFFRFLSATGFHLPGFEMPISREIKKKRTRDTVAKIRNIYSNFEGTYFILIKRESRYSETLSCREMHILHKNPDPEESKMGDMVTEALFNMPIFDIYDEVDEMMHPKRYHIFSMGQPIELPSSQTIFKTVQAAIEVFLKNLEKWERLITVSTIHGQIDTCFYPKGLRIIEESLTSEQIQCFKQELGETLIKDDLFKERFQGENEAQIKSYISDPTYETKIKINPGVFQQVIVLRSLVGFNLFIECFSKRPEVNFGVPGSEHSKRVAVPYESAKKPSKKDEFQNIVISVLYSYMSYYERGITKEQLEQGLKSLLKDKSGKEEEYRKWLNMLKKEDEEALFAQDLRDINMNSTKDIMILHKAFGKNRRAISYWLTKCVFPIDLKQYQNSITASPWDLVEHDSTGFTGTKDFSILSPHPFKFKSCPVDAIQATDGKMISLMIGNIQRYGLIERKQNLSLWESYLTKAIDFGASCIIDAGAICIEKPMAEIVPMVAQILERDYVLRGRERRRKEYLGILFCTNEGQWQVYDLKNKNIISRGTTIPDSETFAIYDEARSRGADLKLDQNAIAALSLGPRMIKDSFMQGGGRLRNFGRNQRLIIMATEEVYNSIYTGRDRKSMKEYVLAEENRELQRNEDLKLMTKFLLAWCMINSVNEIEGLLYQFINLAITYVNSKVNNGEAEKNLIEIQSMYRDALKPKNLKTKFQDRIKGLSDKVKNHPTINQLSEKIVEVYGVEQLSVFGESETVCEREVQAQISCQPEHDTENNVDLELIPEIDPSNRAKSVKGLNFKISDKSYPLEFNDCFELTENLGLTTKKGNDEDQNVLSELHFVEIQSQKIRGITLREAQNYITRHIIEKHEAHTDIRLLSNLQINDFSHPELKKGVVRAKLFAGETKLKEQEISYVIDWAEQNLKRIKIDPDMKDPNINIQREVLSCIPKRRKKENRYYESFEAIEKEMKASKNQKSKMGHSEVFTVETQEEDFDYSHLFD